MRKLLALLMLVAVALTGCASSDRLMPSALDREAILPLSVVSDLAGVPMKLACDRRSNRAGRAVWAWEECSGPAKLVYLELYLPPADSEGLYSKAAGGADMAVATVADVQAVSNGRATFVQYGDYYIRIVMLGVERETEETGLLIDWLASQLNHTEE